MGEVAIKEHGHICPWDDNPRGTYGITTSAPVLSLHISSVGGDRSGALRGYQPGYRSHAEDPGRNSAWATCGGVLRRVVGIVDPNVE